MLSGTLQMERSSFPQGWEVETIGQLAETYAGGTPSRSAGGMFGGSIPWVKSSELNQSEISRTEESLTELGLHSSSAKWVPGNTPIVAMYGATAGTVSWLRIRATTNQAVLAIRPATSETDARWLYWALVFHARRLLTSVQGSGQSNLSKTLIDRLELAQPPFHEQRRIAGILDAVDEAVRQTEKLIAKLKQIKAGLLHDLLTRGLDEEGRLRDPVAHPEQFKETELGRLPAEWKVAPLLDVVPEVDYGISAPLHYGDGIPVLRMNNLKNGEVDLSDLKNSMSEEAASLLLQPRDVLFNRTNSIEHVGRTAIWRGQLEKASFASYLVRLSPDLSRLMPEYLNIWLNSPVTQLAIRRYATPGVHQVNINPTNLRKTLIVLPESIEEQTAIVAMIDAHDNRIRAEQAYCDKLAKLKKGLMQDLLTGRVRVTDAAVDGVVV